MLLKILDGQVGAVLERKFSDEAPFLVREDTDSLVALAGHHINVLSNVSIIHPVAGWDLEELKDKLTNAGKKEIVSIRRRAGQVLQREQRADRNLRGAEHYESILRERKVES